MRIVAVIPCHNEAKTIQDIVKVTKKFVHDVIVVDNLSSDNTGELAHIAGAQVALCPTAGAGISTQLGINIALSNKADIIVTLDGDGQHLPTEIPALIKPLLNNDADMVVGLRQFRKYNSPFIRRKSVAFTTFLYNVGWAKKLAEAQCGFRAFNRELARSITISDYKFGFSVETLIKARAKGYRIVGVPVSCIYHNEGISFRHIPVIWSLIKWRALCDTKPMLKKIGYASFNGITRPFLGMGFGRLPFANKIYRFAIRSTIPATVQIVDINGYKMRVKIDKNTPIDGISRRILCDKEYEPFTTRVIKEMVKAGDCAVDIGANVGYYTLLMAKQVGETGEVYAFEPELRNYTNLLVNVELNKFTNITVENKAVSREDGQLSLYVSQEESGEHSLIQCRAKNTLTQKTEVVCLDNYFNGQRVDFIKTDTEGNDANVVSGAIKLLEQNKAALLTEFWIEGLHAANWNPQSYFDLLRYVGYRNIYLLDDFKLQKYPVTLLDVVKYCWKHRGYSANLLCVKGG